MLRSGFWIATLSVAAEGLFFMTLNIWSTYDLNNYVIMSPCIIHSLLLIEYKVVGELESIQAREKFH